MKRDLLMRFAAGFPPTAVLLLTGEDITHLYNLGITYPLNKVVEQQQWQSFMHDFVMDLITVGNRVVVQPVTIHNENWVWYNAELYRKFKLKPPKNWDELLKQAQLFHEHNITPLAISDDPWTTRFLFSNLVASILGRSGYQRLYKEQDLSVLSSKEFQRLLDILYQLRHYRPSPGLMKSWSDATKFVMDGKAAMLVMGDWVLGEFVAAGLTVNRDYLCAPVPESDGQFIIALDSIAYPRLTQPSLIDGQALMQAFLLDRQQQVTFANHKGSTPVRKDVSASELLPCIRDRYASLGIPSKRIFSTRITMKEHLRTKLQHTIAEFWYSDNMTKAQLLEKLLDLK
ncbi:sugar ABC transporter substrate-binding protein [Nitrosomonas sp. PY1]|nr:sugar ABC transporter substrate-binding protein [Nitrosomonas sp. PY1]